jgi:hypothetical protein
MDDIDTIREWLKHVPYRLLSAESGRRSSTHCHVHRGAGGREFRSHTFLRGRTLHKGMNALMVVVANK